MLRTPLNRASRSAITVALRARTVQRLRCSQADASQPPPTTAWRALTLVDGPSWVAAVPIAVADVAPRARARQLRRRGHVEHALRVAGSAGLRFSRDERDVVECLLALLDAERFTAPRERLAAMMDVLHDARADLRAAAYNVVLTACAREAARLTHNSPANAYVLHIACRMWTQLRRLSSHVHPRSTALMYRICGHCNHLSLARRIRNQTQDPAFAAALGSARSAPSHPSSSELATAAFILCLGMCHKAQEAEQLYFSPHLAHHRTNDRVLSALFRAYVASCAISKAESLIAMFGATFLNVQSCNAFVKQCAQLRLQDTAFAFVNRMASSSTTRFPPPNARTYNLLLRGLSAGTGVEDRHVAADRALLVVNQMQQQNIQPTTVTYNTLIRAFVFRNHTHEALNLYRSMPNPNRITFSHMMQAAANTHDTDLADALLRHLEKVNERPNYSFIKSYLEIVAQTQGIRAAFEETKRLAQRFGNVVVFGDVGSAEAIRMALISACGNVRQLDAAFDALRLQLGGDSRGQLAPLYVSTVLMQVCFMCGEHGRALEVFESLKQAGLKPNFEVYESLIYGLASHVRKTASRETMMEQEHCDGEEERGNAMQTVGAVDGTVMESADVPHSSEWIDLIVHLIGEMHATGVARVSRQAAYVYNTVLAAAAAAGNFDLSLQIFNKMTARNNRSLVYLVRDKTNAKEGVVFGRETEFPAATVGTYNSMMFAAWKCGLPSFSFEAFDLMLADRAAEPNGATLSLLADVALQEGDMKTERLQKLLHVLDKVPILPESVCKKRVRLRQKLLALRWS
ncbi:unnamed protein product [Agarophyton chilense]|eukprot:gb/GEZJ01004358.1/.p1 GENE.gb/GEZJ01004358.1/~~gb/GEZJ01004358.1/.p1  ORF type:complete len:801 (-),score=130.60 gb/GEZJ01004358.1/:2457-4859(-)